MGNEWEMVERDEKRKKYLEKVNKYFESRADEISAFASKYGLQIDKFSRESSTWDLRSKHPKGGYLTIFIGLSDLENVLISGVWQIYTFETFSMYTKDKNFINHFIVEVNVTEWLEKALREILSWDIDELKIVNHQGYYKSMWESSETKEDWEKSFQFWPQNYPKGHEPWVKKKDEK